MYRCLHKGDRNASSTKICWLFLFYYKPIFSPFSVAWKPCVLFLISENLLTKTVYHELAYSTPKNALAIKFTFFLFVFILYFTSSVSKTFYNWRNKAWRFYTDIRDMVFSYQLLIYNKVVLNDKIMLTNMCPTSKSNFAIVI